MDDELEEDRKIDEAADKIHAARDETIGSMTIDQARDMLTALAREDPAQFDRILFEEY
jgi:hypothetical protein